MLLSLTISGCASVATRKCYQLKPSVTVSKYNKIKQAIIDEANINGFKDMPNENKPSKFNNFEGLLLFQQKTTYGTDTLKVEFKQDIMCFGGMGMVTTPDIAIKGILEKLETIEKQ